MDNPLWGIIKGEVAMHCYHKSDKLCTAAEQTFTAITPQIVWCMSHTTCHASVRLRCDDAHTDPMDVQKFSPNGRAKRSRSPRTKTSLFIHSFLYQLCKHAFRVSVLFKHGCSSPSFPSQTETAWANIKLWNEICLEAFTVTTSEPVRSCILYWTSAGN